ncbi:MAG: HAD family phosphatase [Candidatus Omnitrophica bacterium]|nr:HAD family phosphatase [Candidatus Omnitrophota bacterium]
MNKCKKYDFSAVLFDMDGVITNTMPSHFDAWSSVLSSAGIRVNCYDIYKREGQDGISTLKDLFREKGRPFDAEAAKRILFEKERLFKKIVRIRFIRGSRPFVRYLKNKNIRLALVTGTSRHEAEKIMPGKLLRLFEVVVTGDEVSKGKPDPEPFLKAVKKLKIHPCQAAVIENAPFGISAAKKAKIFCIALETSLPLKYLRGADRHFKSFAELKKSGIL